MTILLKNDTTDEEINEIKEITKGYNVVIKADANYSMNELLDLKCTIVDHFEHNNSELGDSWTSVSILDDENSVQIGLQALSSAAIDSFYAELFGDQEPFSTRTIPISFIEEPNEKPISFEKSTSTISERANSVSAAEKIIIEYEDGTTDGSYQRIGFPASRKTSSGVVYGFVTSAHGLLGTDVKENNRCLLNMSDKNTPIIGSLISYKLSGSIDAVFIECENGFICDNLLNLGTISLPIEGYGSVFQNVTVRAFGTYGEMVGAVGSSNATYRKDGITLSDLYKVDWQSGIQKLEQGDSGTPLYQYFGTGYEPPVNIHGILVGGSDTSDYFCKINNILSDKTLSVDIDLHQ